MDEDSDAESTATADSHDGATATPPTWGDLFERAEPYGPTEGAVREALRRRRDAE